MRFKGLSETPAAIYMPTYNRAACLDRAIRSALAQTYKNIHVYVSDNASTDATPEVCRKYTSDPRFSSSRFAQNQGGRKNFEALLSSSDEPWLMFLADDDYIDNDYVEKCLSFAVKHNCIRVGGSAVNYADGVEEYRDVPFFLKHEDPLLRLFCFSCIPNTNAVFYGVHRRTTLELDPRMPGNDLGYTCRQIYDGKVAVIGNTHIHRDVTHWMQTEDDAMTPVFLNWLRDCDYTEYMIQNYVSRYSVLEEVDKYYEALKCCCDKDRLCMFLYIMFCARWKRLAVKVGPRPRLYDFIRDASNDAKQTGFAGVGRFLELEEWLRKCNSMEKPEGTGLRSDADADIRKAEQVWHVLWNKAARLYDKGGEEEGLRDTDIGYAQDVLRRSCVSTSQYWREKLDCWREKLARRLGNRYWYGAKIRRIPVMGRVWAEWREAVKKRSQ